MTSVPRPGRSVTVAVLALSAVLAAPPAQSGTVPLAGVAGVADASERREALLRHGMRGAHVERWQRRLNDWLGSEQRRLLSTDGIFGPQTLAATRALQRAADVRVDGVVGPQTRAGLERLVRAPSSAPFEGTVGLSERPPQRGPVAVTDVRFGAHDGFDRVVLDLVGTGRAGWRVLYVDSPVRQQGSGAVVPLAGDAQLQVVLTGISMPADVGGRSYDGPARPGLGRAGVVEDLFIGNLFEGQFAAWIGTRSPERFRVFALDDPQRIVVDVAHAR